MESADMLLSWLRMLAANPFLVFMAIVAATFILEDAATVGAGLLAAEGLIHPGLGLAALYTGIVGGDLALYGLGRAAASRDWLRRRIGEEQLARGRRWLDRRLILTLFGARSVPGLRLPTYTASGFFRISFVRFAAIAIVAAAVWTTAFFGLVYGFGQAAASVLGHWSWAVGVVLLALAIILPRFISPRLMDGDIAADPAPDETQLPSVPPPMKKSDVNKSDSNQTDANIDGRER